jgi:Cu(I)/Ag(I) efflux system membrane protein CusA/SilA
MRWGENALTTIVAVKQKLAELKSGLPAGVEIVETYDRSTLIKRAVNNLSQKLVEELFMVALVCAVFLLHLRSAMVAVIVLPLGILMAFIIMYHQGINANIMSLGGIAIAMGVMVDAAIVMIENVHKHMEREAMTEHNRWQIILKAAGEVGPPIFFSLLIITLSFLPVFSLQAQEGRMFAPLAYTKTYAMAAASILTITLIPVLIGFFIRGKMQPEQANPINRFLMRSYRPLVEWSLRSPWQVLILCGVLLIASIFPVTQLGSEFMPDLDEGDLLYMPTTFPGISAGKAQELLQQTDKLIRTHPEVNTVFGKIGRAETATDPAPLTMIETTIQLKPRSEWRDGMTIEKIKSELNARVQFPGLTNAWVMPIKTRIDMLATGIKTPVGIKVSGPDLNEIQRIGTRIEEVVKQVPGTASAYSERVAAGRYVMVDIDRRAAARFGLNVADVQDVLLTAVGGMNITETVEGLERYPVNLRYPQDVRDSIEELRQLPIVTPSGAQIALAEVATLRIENGPAMIQSENARPNGWIYVDIAGRDVGSYVADAQQRVAQHIKLPAGYAISWSGQFEYMLRAKQQLMLVVPVTLAMIVLLLYVNFRNFTQVLMIMAALPLALMGGFWLLYFLDYNLSVAVWVGFIALAGLAAEIGVVKLVYLNLAWADVVAQAQAENRALTLADLQRAIIKGALQRVRPIAMTAATILAGLLPVMLGSGTGSEVMRRIAAPIVGGVSSSVLLIMIVLPALFLLWKRKEVKWKTSPHENGVERLP